ncbi:hypothetical protein JQC92_02570 [Shewanella sp. 202IG2-18]|uniref:hypothetical protein n=1 Tax=Parashewanella hymeniacidonis TaxID=2807618 RepID=UPI00195F6C3F|nr:hypothetical protein [Parashewanella hymeniacidonis]MBM7070926.1 hypothetical protein [Parashewanella hymeniacidonis]
MAFYFAVTDKKGKHIQVDQKTGQLEIYESKDDAVASIKIVDSLDYKVLMIQVSKPEI